jgi:hypothetical protein
MFDISELLKNLQELIDIQDGPGTSLDLLVKGQDAGEASEMSLPIGQDKESIKSLMQMAGVNPDETDFEIEPIDGGLRMTFESEESRAKVKELLENLFKGDMLQTLLGGLMQAFMGGKDGDGGLADLFGKMGESGDENSE